MSSVKVKVLGAYVDGHGPGSVISVDGESATYLERIGYAEVVEDKKEAQTPKADEPQSEDKPKSTKKKKSNKSKDDK